MLQWKSHQLETVHWQQPSVGNNNKWIKVTTPLCISESAKSLSLLCMNGMLQVYSCWKKSALKRARFWWQGSVLSWRCINKHLVSQTDFHYICCKVMPVFFLSPRLPMLILWSLWVGLKKNASLNKFKIWLIL